MNPNDQTRAGNREGVDCEQRSLFCPGGLEAEGGHAVYPDKQTTFDKNEVRWWSQVSTRERMVLVVQEIRETEKGRRCQKAIVPAGTNGGMGRGLAKVLDLERYMDDS